MKGFPGKWRGPPWPYTFPQRCAYKEQHWKGRTVPSQGLSRGPGRQQRWGGQRTAPLITGACGDRERPRSCGHIKAVSQDLAQQDTGTAQLQYSPGRDQTREPQQPEVEEEAQQPRLLSRAAHCTRQGRAAQTLPRPSALMLLSWSWAQAAESPRRSGQNLGPDTNLLKWLMTQYSGVLGFRKGWTAQLSFLSLYLRQPAQLRTAWELQHAAIPVSCKQFS